MKIAVISICEKGYKFLEPIKREFPFSYYDVKGKGIGKLYKELKDSYDIVIFIANVGIVVRTISPFLESKWKDPGILAMDTTGRYIIPIIGGHWGLANSIAKKIGELTEAIPIITTRSELLNLTPFDLIARKNNLYIENSKIVKVIATRLSKEKNIKVFTDLPTRKVPSDITILPLKDVKDEEFGVVISEKVLSFLKRDKFLFLRPKNIVIGVGYRKKESPERLRSAIDKALFLYGISSFSVKSLSTIDIKRGDGIAEALGNTYKIRYVKKEDLLWIDKVYPGSFWVRKSIGIGSVSFSTMIYGHKGVRVILESENIDGVMLSIGKTREVIDFGT